MSNAETAIFRILKKYRESSNRERFILPTDKKLSFFVEAVQTGIASVTEE